MLALRVKSAVLVAACALAGPCPADSPDVVASQDAVAPNAWDDPATHDTLQAMSEASTWYHPDLFGMTVGMRRYAHRQFGSALHYFEIGAFYADKLSQLNIGLMHLNGEGTSKDSVVAYAWIDLAAERGYPAFVATRDTLRKVLTPAQFDQATALRRTLAARYGDAVAKPRMAVQLHQGQMQFTGSRTGFDFGVTNPVGNCGPPLRIGGRVVPEIGCMGPSFWAKENWQPELYFAARDREWKANVSVGPVEGLGPAPVAGSGDGEAHQ